MDNVATHKTAAIKRWLTRRPHYHVHFTPTSASWINQVERWFADLTDKQLRRGVHRSTRDVETAIRTYIESVNAHPEPLISNPATWRASSASASPPSEPHKSKAKSTKLQLAK